MSRNRRVRKCGRYAIDRERGVPVRVADDVAHFSGLMLCGSVWACPVCSAKIRQGRADEISAAMRQHLDAGGLALFVTVTVPHGVHHRLRDTFALVADGWRSMNGGRAGKDRRERHGVLGSIRSLEVTHGVHGWHPHLHALVLLEVGRTEADALRLGDELLSAWCDQVAAAGHERPSMLAQRVEVVADAEGVSRYVAKVQDDHERPMPVALELARHDVKNGRRGSRTPFEILRDFRSTGDMADLLRWWEYEEVTRRRHAITWSKGLRSRFDLELVEDEVLAEDGPGGITLAVLPSSTWSRVIRVRGAGTLLLEAAESAGVPGLRAALASLGLPTVVGVPPADAEPPP